jgi:serine protease Do
MPDRSRVLLVAVVLVVGLASGGVATAMLLDSPSSPSPTSDAETAEPTSADSESSPSTASDGAERRASASVNASLPETSAYTAVYDGTIDSVVTIRIEGPRGGQGSGFVYDEQGHVVTNEHVVGEREDVLVRFSDGTWREATVVGTDTYTDLAILEVERVPDYVDPLPLADENPRPGRRVAALGSPFGLEGSITSGIVSGVNRSMETSRGFSIPATVQTDAPINPGNSGGPLVSLNGTVVGVNRAKQGDNIGYAISPQLVERVVPELIADGSYEHSFVGVRTIPVTPAIAEGNGLDRSRGVLVIGVLAGPADGVLQPAESRTGVGGRTVPTGGDVILSIDGMAVASQQDLSRVLMLHTRPGDTVTVTVSRNGERRTVEMTLAERPDV